MMMEWIPSHQHVKSGGFYRFLHRGVIEADMTPIVVYQGKDRQVWVRPAAEFDDGRFVAMNTNWNIDPRDAEIAYYRAALEQLAKLGNGDHYGNSTGNMIARTALMYREIETELAALKGPGRLRAIIGGLALRHGATDAEINRP